MNNPRILVTGGSGLLGSYLLRWFRHHGYTQLMGTFHKEDKIPEDLKDGITWRSLILPDIPNAFEIVRDQDWVIHTAGLVSYNHEERFRLLDINKTGTEIIVNACLAHNVDHLIYIGSIAALGKERNYTTLNESNEWVQNDFSTPYGLSKYLAELEVWRGAGEGLNVSVILPSIILGTGDWQSSSLQLFDRVAHKMPWYPGGQTGYVDVRDVADFVGHLLEHKNVGERWLVNGVNMSYKEIYLLIADKLGLKRKYMEAPEWLSKIFLLATNITKGRFSVPDLLHQVYGTFSYDAAKSLTVDGFHYRTIEKTIEEVVEVYLGKEEKKVLEY
ncbi:MAG TPA: NAD-dependent epimerase/dehydratase family protein [Saprospiraceae bacterium]|nr:NAD-dependent epimerase/dehydratase family protein [Saprospiraceae bacterium]